LEASPLHGLHLKLERKADLRNGCCTNFAVVHASQGHAAELRCAGCGSHRDVHVIRDTPRPPPRVPEQGNHRRETEEK
jgi:hypothetical protein